MKLKKSALLFVCLFSLLSAFALTASATTVSVDTPASSEVITDTYNISATVTYTADDFNATYCTFATTDDGVIANITHAGVNSTGFSTNNDTTLLTESSSTTITATCYNQSNGATISGTATSVAIDNSDPVCSCSFNSETVELGKTLDYDCKSSSDAYSTISYSITATFDDGTTETKTASEGSFENTFVKGEVTAVGTVTDQASNSNTCSTISSIVKGGSDAGDVAPTGTESNTGGDIAMLIGALALVGIIAFVLSEQNKKGKKTKKTKKRRKKK